MDESPHLLLYRCDRSDRTHRQLGYRRWGAQHAVSQWMAYRLLKGRGQNYSGGLAGERWDEPRKHENRNVRRREDGIRRLIWRRYEVKHAALVSALLCLTFQSVASSQTDPQKQHPNLSGAWR